MSLIATEILGQLETFRNAFGRSLAISIVLTLLINRGIDGHTQKKRHLRRSGSIKA